MCSKFKYRSRTAGILAQVIECIEYEFVLLRPVINLQNLNISRRDTVSVSKDVHQPGLPGVCGLVHQDGGTKIGEEDAGTLISI